MAKRRVSRRYVHVVVWRRHQCRMDLHVTRRLALRRPSLPVLVGTRLLVVAAIVLSHAAWASPSARAEIGGPLLYNELGTGVEHTPHVHLIFLGSNFTNLHGSENEIRGAQAKELILRFFEGLSHSPSGEAWQGILTQYFDPSGRVSQHVIFAPNSDVYTNPEPAMPVTTTTIPEEVNKAISAQRPTEWTTTRDDQFLVLVAPGVTYSLFDCAMHVASTGGALPPGTVYGFVAYGCPSHFENLENGLHVEIQNPVHTMSAYVSHEYAESVVDPVDLTATEFEWPTAGKGGEEEVADFCEEPGIFELANGAWVQDIYDDHLNECSHSDPTTWHVLALTGPAKKVTATGAILTGTVNPELKVAPEEPETEPTTYHFEYGATSSYGTSVPLPNATGARGRSNEEVTQAINTPSTPTGSTYHYRLVALNSHNETAAGADKTFTTLSSLAPTVTEVQASGTHPEAGGNVVTIVGTNFAGVSGCVEELEVKFGPSNARVLKAGSASIEVQAPRGAAIRDVTVTNCHGTSSTSHADLYAYESPASAATPVAWGHDVSGQLGDGTTTDKTQPTAINGLTEVTAVAAGREHSLALLRSGKVFAWGRNVAGDLGDGSTENSNLPVEVSGLKEVVAIAAGRNFSLALLNNGKVMAWGYNAYGELGNGTNESSTVPVPVFGLSRVTAIAAGGDSVSGQDFALAVEEGTVKSWGYNRNGQLGNGTTSESNLPAEVSGLSGVMAISAGGYHSLALLGNGTVKAWGSDGSGQLGNGSTESSDVPVTVCAVSATGPCPIGPYLSGVTAVSAGAYHSLALLTNGTVDAWGAGPLGNGGTEKNPIPVEVHELSEIASVAAGGDSSGHGDFSIVLRANGTLKAWGSNRSGQLGNGATVNSNVPVTVGAQEVSAVSAGGEHGLAARANPRNTTQFGSFGSGNGQFRLPWAIAYTTTLGQSRILVTDLYDDRVESFKENNPASYEYFTQFGSEGTGAGQFTEPMGIAISPGGSPVVWVVNGGAGAQRVEGFKERSGTAEFQYVGQLGIQGTGEGQLVCPDGIAIDQSPHNGEAAAIWIADSCNNRIVGFSANGKFVQQLGSTGSGNGQLNGPKGVAVDAAGDVWVADTRNNRVEEFKREYIGHYAYQTQFGAEGSANGQFEHPQGIAVDSNRDIWVADTENHRVQEFSETGHFIQELGSLGSGQGQLQLPWSVTTDSAGNVYVVDVGNERVAKWGIP